MEQLGPTERGLLASSGGSPFQGQQGQGRGLGLPLLPKAARKKYVIPGPAGGTWCCWTFMLLSPERDKEIPSKD